MPRRATTLSPFPVLADSKEHTSCTGGPGSLTPFFTAGTRNPALVTLPGRSAPRGARLVRLRVRDRPGSLAAVTGHLADFGVDFIRVEVLNRGTPRQFKRAYLLRDTAAWPGP